MDVIPHFLREASTPPMYRGDANYVLRLGEVQESVLPNDERSRSKKFTEYRVLVQNASNDTSNLRLYENCLLMNPLCGLADYAEFTLRADKSENKNDQTGLGKGSKVLILSVNGAANFSYIIGGVRDESDQRDKDKVKDLGHHLYFTFNGVSFFVDKDGQLVVTYGGKTGIDGKREDGVPEADTGTSIKFGKKGDLELTDRDGKNRFLIDHENDKVVISRTAFELGGATDKMMKGTTYRDAQSALHKDLIQQLTVAATALQVAATAMKVPITGAVAAAPQFDIAAQQLIQAVKSLNVFEGKDAAFLSDKDKLG